jgi:predicted HTH domain antitoxin
MLGGIRYHGQLNLSGAARYAGIGVEPMMRELARRGIEVGPSVEQFADGLQTLADLFGKEELRAAAAEVRKQEGQ